MAQDILVNYKSNVTELTNQLKLIADRMDRLEAESKSSAKGVDQLTKSVDKLDKELEDTGKSTGKATQNIKDFSKTATVEANKIRTSVSTIGKDIALGIGAAFSVQAIIQFSKASVNAFIEAQKNADKLRFAIIQIQGESEAAFDKLIKQSEELQKISIFSDDSIQQAQAALATFGLTSDQIEEIIPKLADFATITGQDIPSAAQSLGQAIQGRAGEFKKFGVDVSEANTEVENLANIMKVLATQEGAAAKATQTLAGQIEQARNQVDDFQENLGQGIVAYFTTFINSVRPAVEAVLQNIKELFAVFRDGKKAATDAGDGLDILKTVVQAITFPIRALFEVVKLVTDGIVLLARVAKGTAAAITVAFQGIGATVTQVGAGIANVFTGITNFDPNQIRAGLSRIKEPIKEFGKEISDAFNEGFQLKLPEEAVEGVKEAVKVEDELLTRLELRKKTTQELIDLQKIWNDANTVNGRSNLKLINEELKLREKQAAANQKLIEQLKEMKASIDGSFVAPRIESPEIEVPNDVIEPINDVPITLEPRLDLTEFNNDTAEMELAWEEALSQMADLSAQIISNIAGIFSNFSEAQIEQVDERTQKQLDALDVQEKAIEENLNKRRLTEKQAEAERDALAAQRVKTEEEAARKIREIKRKQAIIDKIAALFEIAINTAKNITSQPGPLGALIPFWALLGATEAALVASQPIPYKKGSKDTGSKGHLARVGEEGEEIVYMPAHSKVLPARQTTDYSDALDSMFNNSFNKEYVKLSEISPRLLQGKKQDEQTKRQSFGENLARSISFNLKAPKMEQKDSMIIENWDELADIIDNRRTSHKRR